MRHSSVLIAGLVTVALTVPAGAQQHGTPVNSSANTLTFAAFGDWPYSNNLLANAAAFLVSSVNGDPQVRFVVHVGDIHSGSMPCTGA